MILWNILFTLAVQGACFLSVEEYSKLQHTFWGAKPKYKANEQTVSSPRKMKGEASGQGGLSTRLNANVLPTVA